MFFAFDPCQIDSCSLGETCHKINGFAFQCKEKTSEEFTENPSEQFPGNSELSLCDLFDVKCDNGTCIDGLCSCDPNFVNIDNVCEKTCALTPCQESDIFARLEKNKDGRIYHCDNNNRFQQKL